MALTIPAGVVLGNADSYISLIYAESYHEAVGHTDWLDAEDERKEWLLKRASMIIDARYAWIDPEDFTSVPRPVQLATAELAYHYLSAEAPVATPIKSVQVGAIGVDFADSQSGPSAGIFGFIDMILSGIASQPATSSGGAWGLVSVHRA